MKNFRIALLTGLGLATVSCFGQDILSWQFSDAVDTRLADLANDGTVAAPWNANFGNPDIGLADGSGLFSLGDDGAGGASSVAVNGDLTRTATLATAVTTGDYVFEIRFDNWNLTGGTAGSVNQGINFKFGDNAGGNTVQMQFWWKDSTRIQYRNAISGAVTGTNASVDLSGNSGSDLTVRVSGNLDTGAYTTSYSLDGTNFTDLITDGGNLTQVTQLLWQTTGGAAWLEGEYIDLDYIRLVKPVEIQVVLPDSVGHKYRKTVFGSNCLLLTRPFDYTLPGFVDKYIGSGKPFFRFPGGTPSNFFNFETGLLDQTAEDDAARRDRNISTNEAIVSNHGESGFPTASFFEFASQTGAQYSISINMTSMTPADNKRFMESIQGAGGEPGYIELGNELYFGTYENYIESGTVYVEEARSQAAAIREVFPGIRIGALIPSQIYTDESFLPDASSPDTNRQGDWLTQVAANQDFFDSVVIHLYSKIGMDSTTPENEYLPYDVSYKHAISHVDGEFDPAMEKVQSLFPEKDIWVTEYHLGGFSSNLSNFRLRYSYLGNLYASYFFLKLIDSPQVTVSHWHSFIQMLTWPNSPDDQTVLGNRVSYELFSKMGELAKQHSYASAVDIQGQTFYQGSGTYQDSYPEVFSVFLHGVGSGTLVLVNKLATPYLLTEIQVQGLPGDYPLNITSIEQIRPKDGLTMEDALRSETEMTLVALDPQTQETLNLPPYSITLVQIEPDWEISGLPPEFVITDYYISNELNTFHVLFQAHGGYGYRLQKSYTIEADSWTVIDEVEVRSDQMLEMSGPMFEMSDPTGSPAASFFRIERYEL